MLEDIFIDRGELHCIDTTPYNLHSTISENNKIIEIKDSLDRVRKINRKKFKRNLSTVAIDGNFLLNKTLGEVFSLSLIKDIEYIFQIKIDDSTKQQLGYEHKNLILALKKISENYGMVSHLDFKCEGIQFVRDPDEPEYNTLAICISINEKNIDKLLDIRDNIIEELFKGLSFDMLEKISIVNILS